MTIEIAGTVETVEIVVFGGQATDRGTQGVIGPGVGIPLWPVQNQDGEAAPGILQGAGERLQQPRALAIGRNDQGVCLLYTSDAADDLLQV